ncbi:MAG: hypothetical protein LBS16_03485 [Prevotellaceae bacterium]|jgi:hypothetical protein|nr:hypothetical protein [Prevotellaceae bacterium]
MAQRTLSIPKNHTKTLKISPEFYDSLTNILEYGILIFGKKTATDFYKAVLKKVMFLPQMPDTHPKNRFIESTGKVYRNILVEKYAVLYSITARTIHVITIYHTAMNPEAIKRFAR